MKKSTKKSTKNPMNKYVTGISDSKRVDCHNYGVCFLIGLHG